MAFLKINNGSYVGILLIGGDCCFIAHMYILLERTKNGEFAKLKKKKQNKTDLLRSLHTTTHTHARLVRIGGGYAIAIVWVV